MPEYVLKSIDKSRLNVAEHNDRGINTKREAVDWFGRAIAYVRAHPEAYAVKETAP